MGTPLNVAQEDTGCSIYMFCEYSWHESIIMQLMGPYMELIHDDWVVRRVEFVPTL